MARRRFGWLALTLLLIAAGGAGAERKVAPDNPANAKLLKMAPAERTAELARVVGHWCIGAEAFPMGMTRSGRAAGFAYWSLRCADGSAWAVQIDPLGEVTAMDCAHFNAAAAPKECFKKF
jgi:fructose-1,6-bisphosphatase/inositol monophosphatase family enzyme